jgi:hypothetical protein
MANFIEDIAATSASVTVCDLQILYKETETGKYDLEHSVCVYGSHTLA